MSQEIPAKKIHRAKCIFCHKDGETLYKDLADKLFKSEGIWDVSRCLDCQLLWLNPYPSPDLVNEIYKEYYTHEGFINEFLISGNFSQFPLNKKIKYSIANAYFGYKTALPHFWSTSGYIIGLLPWFRKKTFLGLAGLNFKNESNLLDIGCGNGDFLLEMKHLGWNVFGTEVDKKAVLAASSIGVVVKEGFLEGDTYSENFFSAINMNNVIEHLPDPEETLRNCYKILKPGGLLSIRTCSNSSLAHSLYKENYRGLEIPRHFFVFSPKSLIKLGELSGLTVQHISTHLNKYIWFSSQAIKNRSKDAAYVSGSKPVSALLSLIYAFILLIRPQKGDDVLIILKK